MKNTYTLSIIGIVTLMMLVLFSWSSVVHAITNLMKPVPSGSVVAYSFFSATTTTATSTNDGTGRFANITAATKVELFFTHGGVATTSAGTSTFSVQVTPDLGTTWYNYNKMISGTSSAVVASISLAAATTTAYANLSDILTNTMTGLRCIMNKGTASAATTDGEGSCSALIEY